MSFTSSVVFAAPRPSYGYDDFPNELIWIPHDLQYKNVDPYDRKAVLEKARKSTPAVLMQAPSARFLVIYLHSNAEDIGITYDFGHSLRQLMEVHVLLVEFPGYGICPGPCSEESLRQTVANAYRFVREVLLWPASDIMIMGRSLGASVAVDLASRVECHGLILVAPFLTLRDLVREFVGVVAQALVNDDTFDNRSIVNVNAPVLIIHGANDWLVPVEQARKLYDLCPHEKKKFVLHEKMGHNDDLMARADLLIWPMLCFFQLPDYTFDEIKVPREAFDKNLCYDYHVAPSEYDRWFKRNVPKPPVRLPHVEKPSSNGSGEAPTQISNSMAGEDNDDDDESSIIWFGWAGRSDGATLGEDDEYSNCDFY